MIKTDVLIIGGGIAGLSLAIKIAQEKPDLSISILTKTDKSESNTSWAQGGVAAVWNLEVDNHIKHIEDTLDAGDGLCDEEIVRIVIEEGPVRMQEIIKMGCRFDKKEDGSYKLGREGGHSENRILHYKDITGWEIQRALNEKAAQYDSIKIYEHFYAINILTQHHLGKNITRMSPNIECYGAYVLNKETKEIEEFLARITVMCTGGTGQVYRNTTNPSIATGDGIAMVYRAKGRLANMEFVQFHPTALYNPANEEGSEFLVSEAVRGFGAILRTKDGKEFMQRYDERLSLAPRDIVARAIDNEMKVRGDDYVFLDCTHLDQKEFLAHFPNIYDKCKSLGIDPFTDFIPVLPACHYMCGGIITDSNGRTSIARLYAAGECTCSGLHGANRLASNSLLEGAVFGYRVAEHLMHEIHKHDFIKGIPDWDTFGTIAPKEMVLLTQSVKELKEIMSSYVGIVRTDVRLKRALDRLSLLHNETEELYNTTVISPQLCELRNLITIAFLTTKSAHMRKESRGLHYNTDYPEQFDYLETTYL